MRADSLLCIDRIEGDKAILLDNDGAAYVVPIGDLPDAKAGNIYRLVDGRYCRDTETEMEQKEMVRRLQQLLFESG